MTKKTQYPEFRLSELGILQGRNITDEDVGEQIVDFQARLTNLRRTEANLQIC